MRAQSIGIFILLLTLISCNNKDGYSLGDFQVSIATIILEGENSYSILLDNGKKLWPSVSDIRYKPKENQRAFVNYTLLSDKYDKFDHIVKVNAIWNILTKDIIDLTEENENEIGNDPVKTNYLWIANDFLNIDFMFNYGAERPHYINLVNNKTTPEEGEDDDVIELEFRHNSYDSQNPKLSTEGLVSFNIKSLQRDDRDSVKLKIKVKELDKVTTHDITYKYNLGNSENSYIETPILVVASDEYY